MKHHKFLIPALGLPVSMHLCAQTSIGNDGWEQAQFELVSSHCAWLIESRSGAAKLPFLDIRTRAEAMYVGMPEFVDALAPDVKHQDVMTDWDAKRNSYQLEPVQDFVPEVRRRLQKKGLSKTDPVVLICRSGDRSARAADRQAEDGFTNVGSVADGFEGNMNKDGRRSVDGWKNAGLPWIYKLDREKMYFPR